MEYKFKDGSSVPLALSFSRLRAVFRDKRFHVSNEEEEEKKPVTEKKFFANVFDSARGSAIMRRAELSYYCYLCGQVEDGKLPKELMTLDEFMERIDRDDEFVTHAIQANEVYAAMFSPNSVWDFEMS